MDPILSQISLFVIPFKQAGRLKTIFRRPVFLKRTLMDIHIRA